jgi:apolipoprotein N-acyltransferase
MNPQLKLRRRFWYQGTVALIAAFLAILTAIRPAWIEFFFGIEPDEGSGFLELLIVVIAIGVAVATTLGALSEWRRFRRFSASA